MFVQIMAKDMRAWMWGTQETSAFMDDQILYELYTYHQSPTVQRPTQFLSLGML